jgi:hypothetical protein
MPLKPLVLFTLTYYVEEHRLARMLNRGAVALIGTRQSGLTQEQIAEKLGCSQPFVSRLLRGEVPKLAALRQAAHKEFGIEPGAWDETVPDEAEKGAA